ncbi:MAG: phosphomannomutase, partial [Deltaproteobacteria bacterium]|nr:phosphomannomutase [Deltaproteobacteria bacterium]
MNPRVFREYDIRGVAETDFPSSFVADLGRAIGTFLVEGGARTITLGRDCRLSSPRIHSVIREAILSTGLDVVDVGI